MVGEQVSSLPPAPTARACSGQRSPYASQVLQEGLETKVRIIRALAQHGGPAGKSSFPFQDPLRSCTGVSSWPHTSHCVFMLPPVPAAGGRDCK